jgi:hypothetical protein
MEDYMSNRKLPLLGFMVAALLAGSSAGPASANALVALSQAAKDISLTAADTIAIPVAHGKRRLQFKYKPQHQKFHQRYRSKQKHYGDAHNKFHKHHRGRHDGPDFYFGWGYRDFYDPFYYSPYTYDPYYWSYEKVGISCSDARRLLRQQGYRNVSAYDCSGTTYGLYGTKGKTRYRISVSARDGRITGRRVA